MVGPHERQESGLERFPERNALQAHIRVWRKGAGLQVSRCAYMHEPPPRRQAAALLLFIPRNSNEHGLEPAAEGRHQAFHLVPLLVRDDPSFRAFPDGRVFQEEEKPAALMNGALDEVRVGDGCEVASSDRE